eukprot:scaffold234757_cov44-Prasinocladus_malaysianus.AAC.2
MLEAATAEEEDKERKWGTRRHNRRSITARPNKPKSYLNARGGLPRVRDGVFLGTDRDLIRPPAVSALLATAGLPRCRPPSLSASSMLRRAALMPMAAMALLCLVSVS